MAKNTFDVLRKVVAGARCLPGWEFSLVEDDGALQLYIQVRGVNNYDHSQPFVSSIMCTRCLRPPSTRKSWRRWLFEQCRRTMNHELGESLRFGEQEVRPFAPMHGPGEDPYTVHEIRPEIDALTIQDGSVRQGPV